MNDPTPYFKCLLIVSFFILYCFIFTHLDMESERAAADAGRPAESITLGD